MNGVILRRVQDEIEIRVYENGKVENSILLNTEEAAQIKDGIDRMIFEILEDQFEEYGEEEQH